MGAQGGVRAPSSLLLPARIRWWQALRAHACTPATRLWEDAENQGSRNASTLAVVDGATPSLPSPSSRFNRHDAPPTTVHQMRESEGLQGDDVHHHRSLAQRWVGRGRRRACQAGPRTTQLWWHIGAVLFNRFIKRDKLGGALRATLKIGEACARDVTHFSRHVNWRPQCMLPLRGATPCKPGCERVQGAQRVCAQGRVCAHPQAPACPEYQAVR